MLATPPPQRHSLAQSQATDAQLKNPTDCRRRTQFVPIFLRKLQLGFIGQQPRITNITRQRTQPSAQLRIEVKLRELLPLMPQDKASSKLWLNFFFLFFRALFFRDFKLSSQFRLISSKTFSRFSLYICLKTHTPIWWTLPLKKRNFCGHFSFSTSIALQFIFSFRQFKAFFD